MSPDEQTARNQLELAEAELAVLKQEHVLRHLLETGEASDEARAQLAKLRETVANLMNRQKSPLTQKAAS